ncbi:NAD(P)/FAD-dependent oxidoreductase [Amycolatopsis sp. YIM 10]|uniref:flavin-containing monooxygenase n=1 Tax=Amycolatopsis sp. YIM 10 TaxID=2653857 RepID=UPI0012907883|nr:NAD(P)/FAD-dependent oxidoreductase [Amycolatopsis sp. YIM 10]QFU87167.1 putative oxidoreductase CzcO [Amycolatopsis sp. YIM 10]
MNEVVIIGGGQSGLSAARALNHHGIRPLLLEAGPEPTGSWAGYYDSLTLFSPARYSGMPGQDFPGAAENYPHRDEVVDYLRRYAGTIDADIRADTTVTAVEAGSRGEFLVRTGTGDEIPAAGLIAATGSFGNPHLPAMPGFTGRLSHVADYRNPKAHHGERLIVVGGGNSGVQVAYELAEVADVTLATRAPITFLPQRRDGRDVHHWLAESGFDQLPPQWLIHYLGGPLVMDTGDYRAAVEDGRLRRREMFTAFDGDQVVWPDGERERVDTVLFATGYRPHLGYLDPLGALHDGMPLHGGGLSMTHPGLGYVGLEFQRSFSSNTLRGVHRDAEYVVEALVAHVRDAPAAAGVSTGSGRTPV